MDEEMPLYEPCRDPIRGISDGCACTAYMMPPGCIPDRFPQWKFSLEQFTVAQTVQ